MPHSPGPTKPAVSSISDRSGEREWATRRLRCVADRVVPELRDLVRGLDRGKIAVRRRAIERAIGRGLRVRIPLARIRDPLVGEDVDVPPTDIFMRRAN